MGTITYSYTFTGAEGTGVRFFSGSLPNFSGAFSVDVTLDHPASMILNHYFGFGHIDETPGCFSWTFALDSGHTTYHYDGIVGSSGWSCTDFNMLTYGAITASDPVPAGWTVTVVVTAAGLTTEYCAYGTTEIPGRTQEAIITIGLIDIVVTILGGGPLLVIALDTLIGSAFQMPNCSSPPPAAPDISSDDMIGNTGLIRPGSWGKFLQAFEYGAWHHFCQCASAPSGDPEPIEYPVHVVLPPALTNPHSTPVPCGEAEICSVLNLIVKQINSINVNINYPRLAPPISSYASGTSHGPLTGQGSFPVQGILGLSASVSALPPGLSSDMDTPPTYYNIGAVTFGNAEGWEMKKLITHITQLWWPLPSRITEVAYTFPPGAVVTLTELVAAP